ncbi:protein of unknown function [Xenorhabdus poinarii G6]|uniref:Uncharacterized protein n=1 Tax=Xenorhabdus poinarii G6 TaxID=1354304 RepID=A0A068R5C8_9GAMM|nr:protein of unknown function [Xenorhabdus poinarii G6]
MSETNVPNNATPTAPANCLPVLRIAEAVPEIVLSTLPITTVVVNGIAVPIPKVTSIIPGIIARIPVYVGSRANHA